MTYECGFKKECRNYKEDECGFPNWLDCNDFEKKIQEEIAATFGHVDTQQLRKHLLIQGLNPNFCRAFTREMNEPILFNQMPYRRREK